VQPKTQSASGHVSGVVELSKNEARSKEDNLCRYVGEFAEKRLNVMKALVCGIKTLKYGKECLDSGALEYFETNARFKDPETLPMSAESQKIV
jgi:hypothetical protein